MNGYGGLKNCQKKVWESEIFSEKGCGSAILFKNIYGGLKYFSQKYGRRG